MNGLLQFTLGLNAGGFISNLGGADAKLKSFVGGMIGLSAIVAGVQSQIEKGAGLKQLSDQTGTSISTLYRLQRGFKAVGLDAGSVGNTIFMLNKALGGVNDNGEPTAGVFAQMGLSIDDLKKLNAPQQLLSISAALNKLDNSSATSAAGKIFGRYNAREFLQLARNADEFADALRKGGTQAAIFERYGRTFERIEILSGQLKEKLGSIFLGIAAGVGPGLENIMQILNGIDLSKIGANIGTWITGMTQAFREGKFSEMIADSLKIGFEAIVDFAPGIFAKVGVVLLKAFEMPLNYIQAGMTYALEYAAHQFATNPAFKAIVDVIGGPLASKALGYIGDTGAPDFKQIMKDQKESGVQFDLGTGAFDLNEADDLVNQNLRAKVKEFSGKWGGYFGKIMDFASRAPQPDAVNRVTGGMKETFGAGYIPEHTALEKMGLVFRGGAGSADHASQTARNTRETVNLLQEIKQQMKSSAASFRDPFENNFAV